MQTAHESAAENGEGEQSYSAWHRMLEVFGVFSAYSMVCWLCYRFVVVAHDSYAVGEIARGHWLVATIVGALLAGYVLADFGSGIVHWTFDRYGNDKTWLLGPNFVKPFRNHHVDPRDITRHDFIETNGNNCLFTMPILAGFTFLPLDFENAGVLFVIALWTFASIFTFATNQFHKWAHTPEPPSWAAWLQEKHVILPRDHHKIHHTFPYETHYCITTGWMNGVMSKMGAWAFMERVIEAVSGVRAHRDPAPVELVDDGVR